MKVALFIVVLLCYVGVCLGVGRGGRPEIPEVFSASTTIEIVQGDLLILGTGKIISNLPHGQRIEQVNMIDNAFQHENTLRLERYDLGKIYEEVKLHKNESCYERKAQGRMPPMWDWIKEAHHRTLELGDVDYEYWFMIRGFATVGVLVSADNPDVPVYLHILGPERRISIKFNSFHTDSAPKETHFDIPPMCASNSGWLQKAPRSCVSRSTMTSRAQTWVNAKVPYSQSTTYGGYREDCSGYVSMCWGTSKPGYTTFTMHEIAHPISKNDLAPGDILLCASEHVVLFGGWADSSKTHYIAYEETRPGEGTVKRTTPYPYWYNTGCFLPYRYNSVC